MPRAQLHIEQEKIFTGVVDTWRVGTNQQYLYSIGEYLIFAWLFQRKKVACRGILRAQDSSPLDSLGGSSRLVNTLLVSTDLRSPIWHFLRPLEHLQADTFPNNSRLKRGLSALVARGVGRVTAARLLFILKRQLYSSAVITR